VEIPKNFNWVKARSECSLLALFTHLAEVVASDIEAVKSLPNSDETFTINRPDNKIVVVKTWDVRVPQARSVVFELTTMGISASSVEMRGQSQQLFLAKPSFLASGECKLQIDGESEPLELWQVSRKALEGLFFSRRG